MPAIRPLEDLCLSCGLCCDGSLFWAVPLEEGQTASVPSDTEGYLRQPCPCFSGACTIYKDRPAGCRDFTCHVLDAVAAEQQDRDWALARIAEMRATLEALDAALPGGDPSLYRRAAEFLAEQDAASEDPAVRDRRADVRKAITDYEAALKSFRALGEE